MDRFCRAKQRTVRIFLLIQRIRTSLRHELSVYQSMRSAPNMIGIIQYSTSSCHERATTVMTQLRRIYLMLSLVRVYGQGGKMGAISAFLLYKYTGHVGEDTFEFDQRRFHVDHRRGVGREAISFQKHFRCDQDCRVWIYFPLGVTCQSRTQQQHRRWLHSWLA